MSDGKSLVVKNLVLLVLALALIFLPLALQREAGFEGADGQAEKIIAEIKPGYLPWLESVWEPPSAEVESFLFALQAAVGSGILCYYLGYQRGRRKEREEYLKNVQN